MSQRASVVPASLSFLAIYNPSLGTSEETFEDQIVYYYHKKKNVSREHDRSRASDEIDENREEKGEKLRQIGLAQGMVSFAK